MKSLFVSLVCFSLIVLLSACDTQDKSIKTKASGVLLDNMQKTTKPGDDFNQFVNGTWVANNEIPADRPYTGAFLHLHEQATEDVKNIIEESSSGEFVAGSNEQKVGDLFSSFLDTESRNALGVKPLEGEFQKIAALKTREDLAAYFAEANKLGINVPIALSQYVDFKNPDTYMIYSWQGGLGLPEREYYLEEDEKSVDIRQAYVQHMEKMLSFIEQKNPQQDAALIMALETRIAKEHMKKEDARDMKALYNKIPLSDLSELMPGFAWQAYLKTAGVQDIDGLVVSQLDYMRALDGILETTSMQDWKTFLRWKVLDSYASYLSEEIDSQNFEFFSKKLQGIEAPLPLWKRGVGLVNDHLGEVIGKIYVEKHFPPEAKTHMLELVNNLLQAYEVSIKSLDWMGEETRAQALDKLAKFTPKIGYPDKWRDYSSLEIEKNDLLGNVQRANLHAYQFQIDRQGQKVDRKEWRMNPQQVNAYYNPTLNEIVFPAAILQPPFFNMDADDAVNYGGIGAVIGHEIGHGFDDKGSTFDGDGVLRNWWTDEDRAEFEKRTQRLVEQYSAFKPFEDLSVNGEYTLGENIGDLGGLSIALLAYKLSLDGKEAPVLDGYTGLQRVFIGYGQVWLNKMRDDALRVRIKTDPHSPAQYRINGVVRNIPEFYEAFHVSEEDALYLPPEQRVKIW